MATIDKPWGQAQVDALVGVLDFYLYKGLPVVRKWPYWPPREPHAAERENQEKFAYAVRLWNDLPVVIRTAYEAMAASTHVAPRDIFIRSFINAGRL